MYSVVLPPSLSPSPGSWRVWQGLVCEVLCSQSTDLWLSSHWIVSVVFIPPTPLTLQVLQGQLIHSPVSPPTVNHSQVQLMITSSLCVWFFKYHHFYQVSFLSFNIVQYSVVDTFHSSYNSAGPQSSQSPNSEPPQPGTVQLIMLPEVYKPECEINLTISVCVGIANEIIICTVIVSLFLKWLWLQ